MVGANIRRLRTDNGMTLQAFASRLGVSHQQLQKYETGSNRVSAGVLYRVSCALCVPVGALFEGVDDNADPDPAATDLARARNKCRVIVNNATSLAVLNAMAKVLRALGQD